MEMLFFSISNTTPSPVYSNPITAAFTPQYCRVTVVQIIDTSYRLVHAYRPKFLQSPISTPLSTDRPVGPDTLFPCRTRNERFVAVVVGILVFLDSTFPAKQQKKSFVTHSAATH